MLTNYAGPYYDGDKLGVVCDYTYSLQGADILGCDASTQPGNITTPNTVPPRSL